MELSKPFVRPNPSFLGMTQYKPERTITVNNLAGGLNNVEPDNVIADSESTNTKNMMFISNSLMESRYGTKYVNETLYPDLNSPITWVDEYTPTKTESHFIRATDNAIYVDNTKICDVNGRVRGVNYIGKYYFVDGKYLWVYDGTTYYQVCTTSSHTTAAVAVSGKTFNLHSIPNYLTVDKPLYIIMADGSTVTLDITAIDRVNKTVTVATGHTAVIPKETVVYFYTPLGTSSLEGTNVWDSTNHYAYYEPCTNQLKDEFAGTPYMPDSPNVIAIHQDRIFIAGDVEQPHGVYMSSIASISTIYFPVGAGVSAKPNGDKVIDLIVFDSALIIGRHQDMYVLYGSSEYQKISSDPFYVKQMDVSIGLMCTDCGAMINNFYIFLGYDGRFYKLNTPTTFVEYLMSRPIVTGK